ncbi:MAG: membrane protein [Candidatus Binatia bacterium]|nr:MAG: membrane protein [Candidatus Binatia bacterium]
MRWVKLVLKWVMGVFYVVAGTMHFVRPEFYLRIMPEYLPYHRELVFLSGVCEVVLGVLVLVPRFTKWAAWGIVALLIAVFPANVNMAVNRIVPPGAPDLSPLAQQILLWARLPLQGLLVAWAWWYTQDDGIVREGQP